ncbi:MAG TPA: glycosyl hydrolase, partial [Bacteroidales bacterium]|nr:glycosyl hydrolase [Bacteroidales bacterium]
SDRFLWDFRRTISDLTAENHYDQLTTILKKRGMGRYSESHESGRAFIADGMQVKAKADIPMSATWTPGGFTPGTEVSVDYKADVRESASVSHIYGQNLVAAESLTAIGTAWAWSPETLKPTADMELANGLNRFVIHTSVHQPVDDKIPGLGLGPFGQWFTRNETWAEEAKPWIDYLARNSYMLQQGHFVADILYYYGEDNNITGLFNRKLPDIPEGYNWDFVNADALTNVISFKNGELTSPGGTDYRVLALDSNSIYMSLPVLQKISELVKEGAIVSGPRPVTSPSLKDDENEFMGMVNKMWPAQPGYNSYGKGKVYTGQTLSQVLSDLKIGPDFAYTGSQQGSRVLYVHRKIKEGDIYWINNRLDDYDTINSVFRIDDLRPEIWDPVTGDISQTSFTREKGITKIPLVLGPADALFIVFRGKTTSSSSTVSPSVERQLAVINNDWNLSFQENRGAPDSIKLSSLVSWSENKNDSVRYFSGTGTYTNTIEAPAEWFARGGHIWIDLGDVKNIAVVLVNGKDMGTVWRKPFRVDITKALTAGNNTIEIKVTNLWVNRLIGDTQPGVKKKITYTTIPFYQPDSPLLPSGLLGPVRIFSERE